MRIGKAWAPADVLKDDLQAERGFDEQHMLSTIEDFATKYGEPAAMKLLAQASETVAKSFVSKLPVAQRR